MSWERFEEFKELCQHGVEKQAGRRKSSQRSLFGKRKRSSLVIDPQCQTEKQDIDVFEEDTDDEGELIVRRQSKRRDTRPRLVLPFEDGRDEPVVASVTKVEDEGSPDSALSPCVPHRDVVTVTSRRNEVNDNNTVCTTELKTTKKNPINESFAGFLDMARSFSVLEDSAASDDDEVNWSDSGSSADVKDPCVTSNELVKEELPSEDVKESGVENVSVYDSSDEKESESPYSSPACISSVTATPETVNSIPVSQTGGVCVSPKLSTTMTPPKGGATAYPDSAKKNKHVRDGLAEQLKRVISRVNSEKSVWSHRNPSTGKDDNGHPFSASVCLYIHCIKRECGVIISQCSVVEEETVSGSQCSQDRQWTSCVAVFSSELFKNLKLSAHCSIRIYPPWQEVKLSSLNCPVLLCTFYCEKVSSASEVQLLTTPGPDINLLKQVHWEDFINNRENTARILSEITSLKHHDNMKTKDNVQMDGKERQGILDKTSGAEMPSTSSSSGDATEQLIAQAVFESGGFVGASISFEALIHKVYQESINIPVLDEICSLSTALKRRLRDTRQTQAEARWVILAEDKGGTICEVHVPEQLALKNRHWCLCLKNGQGKRYAFSNLRFEKRSSFHRNPSLLRVISSIIPVTPLPDDRAEAGQSESGQLLRTSSRVTQKHNNYFVSSVSPASYVKCIEDRESMPQDLEPETIKVL